MGVSRNFLKKHEGEVAQFCPTLCDPMDCSLPGSSVHGIFQAIVLEWIAISFSRGSSRPRDRTQVSRTVDRRFTVWATKEEDGSKTERGPRELPSPSTTWGCMWRGQSTTQEVGPHQKLNLPAPWLRTSQRLKPPPLWYSVIIAQLWQCLTLWYERTVKYHQTCVESLIKYGD